MTPHPKVMVNESSNLLYFEQNQSLTLNMSICKIMLAMMYRVNCLTERSIVLCKVSESNGQKVKKKRL